MPAAASSPSASSLVLPAGADDGQPAPPVARPADDSAPSDGAPLSVPRQASPVERAARAEKARLAIRMLADRLLVQIPQSEERTSKSGLLIPATAKLAKRLTWAEVVAVGPQVRTVEAGDSVLFNPEDRYEVDVRGDDYLILRERDIHAVAATPNDGSAGLYL